jgi:hypothetical protein
MLYRGIRAVKTYNRSWFVPALGIAGIFTTAKDVIQGIDAAIVNGKLSGVDRGSR